jgi:hypothetical protein
MKWLIRIEKSALRISVAADISIVDGEQKEAMSYRSWLTGLRIGLALFRDPAANVVRERNKR